MSLLRCIISNIVSTCVSHPCRHTLFSKQLLHSSTPEIIINQALRSFSPFISLWQPALQAEAHHHYHQPHTHHLIFPLHRIPFNPTQLLRAITLHRRTHFNTQHNSNTCLHQQQTGTTTTTIRQKWSSETDWIQFLSWSFYIIIISKPRWTVTDW